MKYPETYVIDYMPIVYAEVNVESFWVGMFIGACIAIIFCFVLSVLIERLKR